MYGFVRTQDVNKNKAQSFEVCIWSKYLLQGIVRTRQWSRWTMGFGGARGKSRETEPARLKWNMIAFVTLEIKYFYFPMVSAPFEHVWHVILNYGLFLIASVWLAWWRLRSIFMMAGKRMSLRRVAAGCHGLTIKMASYTHANHKYFLQNLNSSQKVW